ncbi:hypothetical protein ABUE31_01955 [Mesorhizobium sp. ZMM04-5]|uniref:Uncharacterized protein n=1 Tax=Mesorhizobium marinum TaxID=3228790 RepID=A0ABV3QVQ5_9HYPH
MSIAADRAQFDDWHAGMFTENQLACALACDVEVVRTLAALLASTSDRDGGPRLVALPARARVAMAVAHALHREAGLSLESAADVAAKSAKVCDSILATLDFFPPSDGRPAVTEAERVARGERDPFVLFAPHAVEGLPVPAIDEYLDVIDGRRIVWRRPQKSHYQLACDLNRLSDASAREEIPALQEEFLSLLGGLREPAEQVAEWIGTLADDGFRRRPDRFTDATPFLRQGIEFRADTSYVADAYRTRTSVNVSLAARSMKRRALGLAVSSPLERPAAQPQLPERRKSRP